MLNRPARGKTLPKRDNEHAPSEEKSAQNRKMMFSFLHIQLPTRMMRCDWSLLRATLKLTFNTFPEFFQLSHKASSGGISQLKRSEFYERTAMAIQKSSSAHTELWLGEILTFFSHFFPLSNGLKSRLLPGCWVLGENLKSLENENDLLPSFLTLFLLWVGRKGRRSLTEN